MPHQAMRLAPLLPVHPLAGILAIVALLGALLMAGKVYHKRYAPHPEVLRKVVHIGIGLVTLFFPWLFAETWPVFVLAGITAALMIAVKIPGPLHTLMGGVVDGVKRPSHGDIYFPIGVATLFWLVNRSEPATGKLLFCVPILLLTLGDSVAALVGVRYGRHKFTTADGVKSAEGSLACFVVAFLCTFLSLVLSARMGHPQALVLALIVGLVATLLEAIAWGGLDNLFLPLGGYALLKTHLAMSLEQLAAHCAVAAVLVGFSVLWRRRTSLNDSAALGAALYGYCVWSIGGLDWLYAPAFLFIGYPLTWPRTWRDAGRTLTVGVVLAVGGAGLAWLFFSVAFQNNGLAAAYNVSFGAQMAMIGVARLRHRYPRTSGILLLPAAVAASWLLTIVPTLLAPVLLGSAPHTGLPIRAASAFAGILLAAIMFDRIRRDLRDYPCDPARWQLQAALGALGSAAGMAPALWNS